MAAIQSRNNSGLDQPGRRLLHMVWMLEFMRFADGYVTIWEKDRNTDGCKIFG